MSPAPSGSQPVHIDRVHKSFGGFAAVREFTLDVAAGEFVTFLGPSGCGKSTTLKMISGLLPQDGGVIRFGDRRIDMLPANKRNIGLVFQNYALFPHMSVAENVGFGLRMRGWARAAKTERVGELLKLVRLEGLGDRRPEQLSGGQQQRVAVARALAFHPDLVLLDEPLSNLDAKLREQVRLDLRDIQRRAGQTTIFVTHDQVEALVMSDRIVLMNGGGIEQIGTPAQLYETPQTEFGARFVGANNLFRAVMASPAPDTAAIIEGAPAPAPLTSVASGADHEGSAVWYCVRPEHVLLMHGDAGTNVRSPRFPGTVADKIYQGTTTLVDIDLPSIGRLRAERPAAEVAGLAIGRAVTAAFQHAHAVLRRGEEAGV